MSDVAGNIRLTGDNSDLTQSLNQAGQAMTDLANMGEKRAKEIEAQSKRIEASEKRVAKAMADAARVETKQLQKEIEEQRVLRSKEDTKQTRAKQRGTVSAIQARGDQSIRAIEAQRENNLLNMIGRTQLQTQAAILQKSNALYRSDLSKKREMRRAANSELLKDTAQVDSILRRSLSASPEIQAQVAAAIGGHMQQAQRFAMRGPNVTRSQAFNQQLTAAVGASNAAYLVGGGKRTPTFGGGAGGRGGGGNIFTRLLGGGGGGIAGSIASGLAGGLGVGLGGYAISNIAQGIGEDIDRATAYERQTVAARNLAGSQEKLNQLLAAYAVASGNAIDKTTTLENVTRLMATGFADSAPEVEKFVRATRGASIALGKPQDYVIQETQLAISNTSVKRLDQIGLGISEVNERIEQLRQTNAGWSRETAFQDAVITLLDEKYGKLTKTIEGQASGVEKLRKTWKDFRLELGENAKGPVDAISSFFSASLEQDLGRLSEVMDAYRKQFDSNVRILRSLGVRMPGVFTSDDRRVMSGSWTDDSQSAPAAKVRKGYSEEQQDLISDWYEKFQSLENNYNKQRLAETERYESQRLSVIQNYGKMLVREEEDFVRQRARGLQDYERTIVGIMRDAQERDAEMREELQERIADAREDHEERVADIEKKYQKDREKAWSDHRDRLLKAAGQLDAIAVLEERKRWKKENQEREEGHKEALEEAKDRLQEQIDEAEKAHKKQLEKAQKADADRLAEMAENRRIQLEREDEDRAIRLERAAQDHNDQLAEMDRLHGEAMAKLAVEYTEQRELMEDEFAKAMSKAGIYIDGVTQKLLEKQKLEEEWLDTMIGKYEQRLKIMEDANRYSYDPTTGPNIPLDYGQGLISSAAPAGIAGVSNNRSLTLGNGAIQIFPTPNQLPYDIAQEVEETVIRLMENY